MAALDKRPLTMEELLVSSLAQTDALAKLLIAKGLITQAEFMQKISDERSTYQKLLEPHASLKSAKLVKKRVLEIRADLFIFPQTPTADST